MIGEVLEKRAKQVPRVLKALVALTDLMVLQDLLVNQVFPDKQAPQVKL